MDTVPTFNLGFKYQLIASEISIQPSLYKKAESKLRADEKGPPTLDPGSCLEYNMYIMEYKRKAIHFIHYYLLKKKISFVFFRYFHHLGWLKLYLEVLITTTSMWILLNLTGCGSLRGDFQQLRYSIIRLCCSCL